MRNFKVSEIVGALALDGQNVNRMTFPKQAALKAIALSKNFDDEDIKKINIQNVNKQHFKLYDIEKDIVLNLKEKKLIDEKLSILSCDLNSYTAGVEIFEYRADEIFYSKAVSWLKAEFLENTKPTLKAVIVLVLLRECGVLHDILSLSEQNRIKEKLSENNEYNEYKDILSLNLHTSIASSLSRLIKSKHRLYTNPYLKGIAIIFPFLDRRESIFIDTVVLGREYKDRLESIAEFLNPKGFDTKVIILDNEQLLKIDNMLYKAWASTRVFKFPIQGMVIQPWYREY